MAARRAAAHQMRGHPAGTMTNETLPQITATSDSQREFAEGVRADVAPLFQAALDHFTAEITRADPETQRRRISEANECIRVISGALMTREASYWLDTVPRTLRAPLGDELSARVWFVEQARYNLATTS